MSFLKRVFGFSQVLVLTAICAPSLWSEPISTPSVTPTPAGNPSTVPQAALPSPTPSVTLQHPVPAGEVIKRTFSASQIFPGTTRTYSIYIPREYDPAKPACVYIDQDGVQFNAPAVFDQLIASHEMPVTIGIFIAPGRLPALTPDALDRFNRSFEYDSMGDRYARFILEEMLPEVEKQTASDGRAIHLSKNGNDRCIAGSSSGAICAFTAAWERPEEFSRVFSSIGTYVGLRGGNEYPVLIRKSEPLPLRVFLEDGSTDQNAYGGNWFLANNEMESALTFAGYEVNHSWGTGGHNAKHATEIFPDAMRWLWKDWPAPITVGLGSPQLREILLPNEPWLPYSPPISHTGEVLGTPDILFYIDKLGTQKVICQKKGVGSKPVETGIDAPGGFTLSPDHSLVYVSDTRSRWIYSFQILPDLSLANGQKYFHLHVPDDSEDAGTTSMCVDREGRLYVGTRMGVQICDQAGRVNCIVRTPDGSPVTHLHFAGDDPTVLIVDTAANHSFKRKLKVTGVGDFDAPVKPHAPHL